MERCRCVATAKARGFKNLKASLSDRMSVAVKVGSSGSVTTGRDWDGYWYSMDLACTLIKGDGDEQHGQCLLQVLKENKLITEEALKELSSQCVLQKKS